MKILKKLEHLIKPWKVAREEDNNKNIMKDHYIKQHWLLKGLKYSWWETNLTKTPLFLFLFITQTFIIFMGYTSTSLLEMFIAVLMYFKENIILEQHENRLRGLRLDLFHHQRMPNHGIPETP